MWKFHQIYNFAELEQKDDLVRFWDQKFKGQGHIETTYGQILADCPSKFRTVSFLGFWRLVRNLQLWKWEVRC